jgi:hypothetical protein
MNDRRRDVSDTDETEAIPDSTDFQRLPDKIRSHYSGLTLHRKCPQAWQYRYGFGLRQPISGPAPALHFGSWWGGLVGADALMRGRALDSLIFDPRKISLVDDGPKFDQATMTTKDVMQAAVDWWKTRDETTKAAWEDKMGGPLPKRLRDTYVRWRDEWAEQRQHERPLGLEVFWQAATASG